MSGLFAASENGAQALMIDRLSAIASNYDAILCDVWGVLIDGTRHFRQAASALREFRARGGGVALITNASRPSDEVRRQLLSLGVPADCFDDIVSAGELTLSEIVARKGQSCYHLGPPRDLGLFEAAAKRGAPARLLGPETADYIVCTGLIDDERETPEDYEAALEFLRQRQLPMLCANPDVVVGVGDRLYWCAGALARRYAALGGVVKIYGKPARPIYEAALDRLSDRRGRALAPARVLAIGDGAETDLAGAGGAGLDCLFILEGVHRDQLLKADGALDSEALAALVERAGAAPRAVARRVVW